MSDCEGKVVFSCAKMNELNPLLVFHAETNDRRSERGPLNKLISRAAPTHESARG